MQPHRGARRRCEASICTQKLNHNMLGLPIKSTDAPYNYLKTAPKDVMQSTLVRNRHPWYHQEKRLPPPFLCTYMGRGSGKSAPLYFIWNKSEAIALNTYLMLYPHEELGKMLAAKPGIYMKLFSMLKEIELQEIIANGRVYGGGLYKIEPKELLNVHFMSFPSWLKDILPGSLQLNDL